ncbi:MAG: ATP synthase F1 subunit epsilon, partial [Candidatus Hydrogenedentales bacterium]
LASRAGRPCHGISLMAATLHLELTSPGAPPIELEAVQVVIPGAAGIFTVLPGHTALLTTLTQGVIVATTATGPKAFIAVHGGFAEVNHDRILVLADVMEKGEKVELERAKAARDRAQERLQQPADFNVARAEAALARALARLEAHAHEEY